MRYFFLIFCLLAIPGRVFATTITVSPGQSMQKAVEALRAGDTLLVREGTYETINNAWRFKNTGTATNPITVKNYPNEQAVFKINTIAMEYRAWRCEFNSSNPISWQTPQADYIKLLGSDVDTPRILADGVISRKGLVVLGVSGANAIGIESMGSCNNWEVAGFDFVETGGGIFQRNGDGGNWYVHDNRVYNFYRESGMQFNQHNNQIINNEIYLVNSLPRTYGCQMINLLGHGNVVRNNKLSRADSTYRCGGVLFEWDFSDNNIIEQNTIYNVAYGINFQGGDNNIIRNNFLYKAPDAELANDQGAITVYSYDNKTDWPCDHIDTDCHSTGNQILNNTITDFVKGGVFLYSYSNGTSNGTIIKNNSIVNSNPAIDCTVKYNNSCVSTTLGIEIANNSTTAAKPGDANGDNKVDGIDYVVWLNHYNQSVTGASSGDFNTSGKVDGVDYVIWVNNYGK